MSTHSNIFVGNVPDNITQESLKSTFGHYGTVDSVHVMNNYGRTNAFVKMADVPSAERAISALNGISGWVVKFANNDMGQGGGNRDAGKGFDMGKGWGKGYGKGFDSWGKGGGLVLQPRSEEPEMTEPPASDNLYVKHLPAGITEAEVRETFEKCGEVKELRVLRPDFSLEWPALVRMGTPEQAQAARTTLDNTVPSGSTQPIVATHQKKGGTTKEDHVYIKNVPLNTTTEKLQELFSQYGEVKWCKMMPAAASQWGQWGMGATLSSAALVQMSTEDEAKNAIESLNGNSLKLEVLASPMKVRFAANKAAAVKPEGAA